MQTIFNAAKAVVNDDHNFEWQDHTEGKNKH